MVRCCVRKCKSDSTKSAIRFHAFPRNKYIFKKWIAKTDLFHKQAKVSSDNYFKVCRDHFKSSDYISDKHLKKWSVPSLNLPTPTFLLEHNYCLIESKPQAQQVSTGGEHNLNETSNEPIEEVESIIDYINLNNDNTNTESALNSSNELHKESNFVSEPVEQIGFEEEGLKEYHFDVDAVGNQLKEAVSLPLHDHLIEINSDQNLSTGEEVEENVEPERISKPKRLYNSAARKQRYHESKVRSLKLQVKSLKNKENNPMWKDMKKNMGKTQAEFIEMQIRNSRKSKKGKRYNIKEKSLCLALYKKGPKSYRSFAEVVSLPTKQTLTKHASCAHFQPGINKNLMEFMKETVSKMPSNERICCLSWDEVSLTPELDYSKSDDRIDGFVDDGQDRVKMFANHALTFMVRGIIKPFKQSLAYFLTKPDTKGNELADFIVVVIEAILDTGLNLVLSVCDQIAINITAINCLISRGFSMERSSNGQLIQYTIKNTMITHIFDPCHLIKGIRNNLLTKNLTHFISEDDTRLSSEEERTASWLDVKGFFTSYKKSSSRLLTKINDEHIRPNHLKMKVCVATQIFSHTFGTTMKNYSNTDQMKRDISGTADILIFFNDVFDSFNGAGDLIPNSIKGSISQTSGHVSYWKNSIPVIETMEWVIREKDQEEKAKMKQRTAKVGKNGKTRKEPQPGDVCRRSKVLFNVISTMKGLIFVTEKLLAGGIEHFSPRRLNSDGLENYFGNAKGVCHATKSPTPRQFKSAFTTLFFDNSPSLHSPHSNCEKDDDIPLLETMNLFFKINGAIAEKNATLENENDEDSSVCEAFTDRFKKSYPEDESLSYTAGRICKKLNAKTKCKSCISTFEVANEYMAGDSSTFNVPSPLLLSIIKKTVTQMEVILPSICMDKKLLNKIVGHIDKDFVVGCNLHKQELTKFLCTTLADLLVYAYVRVINTILKGKAEVTNEDDDVQNAAFKFRRSNKQIGKFVPHTD